jgi:hypothetical protein
MTDDGLRVEGAAARRHLANNPGLVWKRTLSEGREVYAA